MSRGLVRFATAAVGRGGGAEVGSVGRIGSGVSACSSLVSGSSVDCFLLRRALTFGTKAFRCTPPSVRPLAPDICEPR